MRALGLRDRLRTALFTALTAVLASGIAWAQPAALVKDINLTREDFNEPLFTSSGFVTLGTEVFFVHNDGVHGYELWKTDGSEAGTVLVKDLCPGTCPSRPRNLTVFGGALFFIADDGGHGRELWKSDGTAAGTALVKDIYPGMGDREHFRSGSPGGLLAADGVLYFAADDREHGLELWKSDGTPEGTVLVRDIHPGPNGSNPRPWVAAGGILLLNADDGTHGREPWVSDGTEAGTQLLKDTNSAYEWLMAGDGSSRRFLAVRADVTSESEVADLIAATSLAFGGVDLVVNNAGLALGLEPAHRASLDQWEQMVDTNIKGLLTLTRAILPGMVARGSDSPATTCTGTSRRRSSPKPSAITSSGVVTTIRKMASPYAKRTSAPKVTRTRSRRSPRR